jgi:hypothetical protein
MDPSVCAYNKGVLTILPLRWLPPNLDLAHALQLVKAAGYRVRDKRS